MTTSSEPSPGRWRRLTGFVEVHSFSIIIGVLVLLALFVYLAPNMIISVGPGHAGVLWSRFFGGTVTVDADGRPFDGRIEANATGEAVKLHENLRRWNRDIRSRGHAVYPYGEGIHFIFPLDQVYIYNIRLQQVSQTYDVLTNDGLEVKAEVTIQWKAIEGDLGKLHRDIGPQYVDNLIIPIVGAYAREEIARYGPDALYSPTRLIIQDAIRAKTKQAMMTRFYPENRRESYVIVQEILIRSVVLPLEVRTAIQEKVVQKHLAESYKYRLDRERQEAERKSIEAEGIQRFQAKINSSISEGYLKWKGIDATLELAKSQNAKIVVIGTGKDGLPIILGGLEPGAASAAGAAPRP